MLKMNDGDHARPGLHVLKAKVSVAPQHQHNPCMLHNALSRDLEPVSLLQNVRLNLYSKKI